MHETTAVEAGVSPADPVATALRAVISIDHKPLRCMNDSRLAAVLLPMKTQTKKEQ